jgi:hypothetical protein
MRMPRSTSLVLACALAALLSAGCAHRHFDRNAPGIVDVRTPPASLPSRAVVTPTDPGEQMLVLAAGPMAGLGMLKRRLDGSTHLTGALALEGSIFYGRSERSHNGDDFVVYPSGSVGLNLGLSGLTNRDQAKGLLYAEGQYAAGLLGAAGGWAWDPWARSNGPQGTLFVGPLYGRVSYLVRDRSELTFGLFFKFHDVMVWSQ